MAGEAATTERLNYDEEFRPNSRVYGALVDAARLAAGLLSAIVFGAEGEPPEATKLERALLVVSDLGVDVPRVKRPTDADVSPERVAHRISVVERVLAEVAEGTIANLSDEVVRQRAEADHLRRTLADVRQALELAKRPKVAKRRPAKRQPSKRRPAKRQPSKRRAR
jgi:hypothetical protein